MSFEARARRYVVIDASTEQQARAEFTPDVQHSGATLPKAEATIDLRDDAIAASRYLPRDGVIRVRNTGKRPHHAFAIRLPADKTVQTGIAELRKGTSNRETVGEPTDLASLLSAGANVRSGAQAEAGTLRHRLFLRRHRRERQAGHLPRPAYHHEGALKQRGAPPSRRPTVQRASNADKVWSCCRIGPIRRAVAWRKSWDIGPRRQGG